MKKRFRNAKPLVFRELQRLGQDSRFGGAHRQWKVARAGHAFDPGIAATATVGARLWHAAPRASGAKAKAKGPGWQSERHLFARTSPAAVQRSASRAPRARRASSRAQKHVPVRTFGVGPLAPHVFQPFTQLGSYSVVLAPQQTRSMGALQLDVGTQQTAAMRSPQLSWLVSKCVSSSPALHCAGIWRHVPPLDGQLAGFVGPHLPFGWTKNPFLQMHTPMKHPPCSAETLGSSLQSGSVVQAASPALARTQQTSPGEHRPSLAFALRRFGGADVPDGRQMPPRGAQSLAPASIGPLDAPSAPPASWPGAEVPESSLASTVATCPSQAAQKRRQPRTQRSKEGFAMPGKDLHVAASAHEIILFFFEPFWLVRGPDHVRCPC